VDSTIQRESVVVNLIEIDDVEICVDGWIIQDGNYGDFHVGEEIRCAFEFHGDLNATAQRTPSMTRLRQNNYQVCAQVVFAGPDAWAVDFGLTAYQEYRPPGFVRIGAWVEGEIGLAIDPFMYKDRLANGIGMPDLFNTWEITGIARDDTPWIASSCGKVLSRDQEHPRWSNVQQTDAWNDDDGRSAYLLRLRALEHKFKGQ
jgi:hypothetical protein